MRDASEKLAELRRVIARPQTGQRAFALGHDEADAALTGGLRCGALHEVFAGDQGAAASGFALGLAMRAGGTRHLIWIRQDFGAREHGEIHANGFAGLGLDPSRLLMVRTHDACDALRASADVLSCKAVGAAVIEIFGMPNVLDLTASRRLTLGCAQKGVTAILLRQDAMPEPSAAETRWTVRGEPSPAWAEDWGAPVFDAQLTRNRHGLTGRWIMEWSADDGCFRVPNTSKTHSGAVVAAPPDRQAEAGTLRLAG